MNTTVLEPNSYVLLVEANEALARHVTGDLKELGYETVVVRDPSADLAQIPQGRPALIVIDRILDKTANEAALDFCNRLRLSGDRVPVVLLMGKDGIDDRVACLEAGADDYLLKPYRTEAFINLARLYLQPREMESELLQFGDLILDLSNRIATRNGRTIDLTMKEFELLKYLMEHPRETLRREQILEQVWGYDFMGESNVIEVYIRYLRLKIEDQGEKRLIQTVRGIGYVLREAVTK